MKLDLFNRLLQLAIILYAPNFGQEEVSSLKKLYTDYYARLNSKAYKKSHKEAFIKGPDMMKEFFDNALVDETLKPKHNFTKVDLTTMSVNLQTLLMDDLIEAFDNNGEFFKGYNSDDKSAMIMTLIGLDQLFLVSQFEYGTRALDAVLHGKHANKGQWWANMELHGFSDEAFLLADKLLQTTKNSDLSHQLNGASALFPTNMTYARFSEVIRGSAKGLTGLQRKLAHVYLASFSVRSNMSEKAHELMSTIISEYMLHIMVLVGTESYRFGNFYIGYYNLWRYNNIVLYNNMSKIIDVP